MTISETTGIREIAAIVSGALERAGLRAVLSGGAAVAIYTENKYLSKDLDFVSDEAHREIAPVLATLGYKKVKGRYYAHPDNPFLIEFPAGPLAVGERVISETNFLDTEMGRISILSATHCAMDRLAAFFHWHDRQALDQAILLCCTRGDIDMVYIDQWAENEDAEDQYTIFRQALSAAQGK